MRIDENKTAIDVAFDLSGSLAGFPALLNQLPEVVRIGFDTFPEMWEDVDDIGQTWTPDLQGKELEINVPIYNELATLKQPYTTPLFQLTPVIAYGNAELEIILTT